MTQQDQLASSRSIKYMMDLIAAKDYTAMVSTMPPDWRKLFNDIIQHGYIDEEGNRTTSTVLPQSDVGTLITQLKKCPSKGLNVQRKPVTEAGMYRVGIDIFKVQMAVHGSGNLYAKKLVPTGITSIKGGVPKFKFVYAPGAIKIISADDHLSMSEAMEFGRLYGSCCICGRTLTNELSIHLGIGPVCGGREFGGDFEFMLKQAKMDINTPEGLHP